MIDAVKIGVLALQGAFREHRLVLARLGADVTEVRLPSDLEGLKGVVIPGGESTTMTKLMRAYDLDTAITDFYEGGGAVWGTCAGAILIASEIAGYPEQPRLGLLEMRVARNAYGRQVDSFEADVSVKGLKESFRMVFIRAPRILSAAEPAEVLASFRGDPVMVKGERLLATVFHPELSEDDRIHKLFLEGVVQN